MSDPTGTVGLPQHRNGSGVDVDAILSGGPEFFSRLDQFARAKGEHDKALNELQLGKSAAEAYAHAAGLRREADDISSRASAALVDANSKSVDILRQARSTADKLVAEAQASAAALVEGAKAVKAAAEAERDSMLADARAMREVARSELDQAKTQREDVEAEKARDAGDRKRLEEWLSHITRVRSLLLASMTEAGRVLEG
jgi:cell division septum initiation protein DivIVA